MTKPRIKSMSPQLVVKDIDRSIRFYVDKLDFTQEFRFEDFYAGVERDGQVVHLKTGNPSPDARKTKHDNDDLDIVFSVDGVDELYKTFSARQVEITQPLCERPYGREFYIADPDGYILAFLEE